MPAKKTKKGKYTLILTEEEMSHFKNALAIAESHYSETFKNLCTLKNVRSNDVNSKETECALFYWDKAGLFADLNLKLQKINLEA